ncbi:alpha/beta fold hydrolase [Methylophaga sulfidovorans]|uniref:Homoserine O-acetyltransferase n=1 Tax=Methylophaga sulfidovorans TaxID=45496 RepID=A0A1I3UB27_9GAMM|nr:alpha/beta fold hydrolase [Methylophaga sulfidovorans]SFJ80112.1 homoserine O-acetyltransferase [Methylophaga sulfidovorans]
MSANTYYSAEQHGDFEVYDLGDFVLEGGATLRNAELAYTTYGELNEQGDNAILFPVMFSGTHAAMAPYVGEGLALDPSQYFIVIPNQLGGGLSTSPHNYYGPYHARHFPELSIGDDVRAQHQLLESLGVKQLQMVTGWSMGAQQTYEWAVRYPDMVKRAAPIGGTAKTTSHCSLFVDVFCEALKSDPAWSKGDYDSSSEVQEGLRRMGHVFAMMGVSREFYNQNVWQEFGFSSYEDFLTGLWENWFLPMDPNNLLCMAKKWRQGDVSRHFDGNLTQALASITAKVSVVSFEKDMFITAADCKLEQQMISGSELISIPSLWGHFTMLGVNPDDFKLIDNTLKKILAQAV